MGRMRLAGMAACGRRDGLQSGRVPCGRAPCRRRANRAGSGVDHRTPDVDGLRPGSAGVAGLCTRSAPEWVARVAGVSVLLFGSALSKEYGLAFAGALFLWAWLDRRPAFSMAAVVALVGYGLLRVSAAGGASAVTFCGRSLATSSRSGPSVTAVSTAPRSRKWRSRRGARPVWTACCRDC